MTISIVPPCGSAPFFGFFDDFGMVRTATLYSAYRMTKSDMAISSCKRYSQAIGQYLRYLDCLTIDGFPYLSSDERLLSATRLHVDGFLRERQSAKISRSTRRIDEAGIKDFYTWLTTQQGGHRLNEHPYSKKSKFTTLRPHKKLKYGLTTDQIIALSLGFYNECERTFIQFAFDTGARISSLVSITKGAIEDAYQYVKGLEKTCSSMPRYVPLIIPLSKKGGNEILDHHCLVALPTLNRVIQYHKEDTYAYCPYWDHDDASKPAFLTATGKQWSAGNARRSIKAAAKRQGISLPHAKIPSPHIFRHSSAYSILTSADHGADAVARLISAMTQLGHTGLSATQIYTRLPLPQRDVEDDSVFSRAERIFRETYLPPRLHKERRGHK